jgi:TolB protein
MSWSPTANQLAFTTGLQDNRSFWGPLRLFDTETGEVTLLSDNVVIGFFWSPNGRYIATINTGDINEDFGVNIATNEKPHRPTQAKPVGQVNPHQFNLALIDLETGQETQVTSFFPTGIFITQFLPFFDQYALSHNIWSPNSDALVLPIRENGGSRVKVIRIDGSEVIDLGQGDMPFWSR